MMKTSQHHLCYREESECKTNDERGRKVEELDKLNQCLYFALMILTKLGIYMNF